MSACKALIRASLSCLEFGAPTRSSTSRFCLPCSVSSHSGEGWTRKASNSLYFSPRIVFEIRSVRRSFGTLIAAVPSEEISLHETTPACTDTVEELLATNKDDISRLMKMERRRAPNPPDIPKSEPWFPYLDLWREGDASLDSSEILSSIDPYLMHERKQRFRDVVNNRSYSMCLVVEGLSDFGNVSATFRSADALGIQSVHVISCDASKRYRDNRHVSMGAEKWLDIELWDSVQNCYEVLRSRGYRIAAAYLGTDTVSVYDIDWCCPTAVVVGNEQRGISKDAMELSDLTCSIPMRGMVDSFNVSVAAGLLMHQAVCHRTAHMGSHGDLTQQQRQILLAEFYLRHNKNAACIARDFSQRKLTRSMSKL